jgi:hypothetical protein
MGELKNRGYLNTTLPKSTLVKIRQISRETKIPISRLIEEALELLFNKYKRD